MTKYDSIIKACSCLVSSQLPLGTLSEYTGTVDQSEREGYFLREYQQHQQQPCDSSHVVFRYHESVTCSICDTSEVFGVSLCCIYDSASWRIMFVVDLTG